MLTTNQPPHRKALLAYLGNLPQRPRDISELLLMVHDDVAELVKQIGPRTPGRRGAAGRDRGREGAVRARRRAPREAAGPGDPRVLLKFDTEPGNEP